MIWGNSTAFWVLKANFCWIGENSRLSSLPDPFWKKCTLKGELLGTEEELGSRSTGLHHTESGLFVLWQSCAKTIQYNLRSSGAARVWACDTWQVATRIRPFPQDSNQGRLSFLKRGARTTEEFCSKCEFSPTFKMRSICLTIHSQTLFFANN